MSHSGKPVSELGLDSLSDRLAESLSCEANKPDFRELDLGSPVSPLRTRQPATSSSSSSSGSVSGRNGPGPSHPSSARRSDSGPNNSHSGELSGSSESSPTAAASLRSSGGGGGGGRGFKPGHARSDSGSSSPVLNVLPTGNICPSGKILKTGMGRAAASGGRSHRSDVLGSGTGNYGHGSIMRGGAGSNTAKCDSAVSNQRSGIGVRGGGRGTASVDPEELKRAGNEQYKRGHFAEALSLYDRAIALSPGNAAYKSNRAAALTGLGRVLEAVKECEEAVRLDPNYGRAHQRLASLFLR